jgi:hypothetical protein
MIQLVSDKPCVEVVFNSVSDASIQYHFVVRAGSRKFIGPSTLLAKSTATGLESRLQEYLHSDDELNALKLDIR